MSARPRRPLVETECPTCGLLFTQKHPLQRYDRPDCRPRRWGDMTKTTKTTTQQGYGHAHQQERRRWEPAVAAGGVECARPDCLRVARGEPRWIIPGEAWDLGHDRATGDWHGPEHRSCNRSEGASHRNRTRGTTAPVESTGTVGASRW